MARLKLLLLLERLLLRHVHAVRLHLRQLRGGCRLGLGQHLHLGLRSITGGRCRCVRRLCVGRFGIGSGRRLRLCRWRLRPVCANHGRRVMSRSPRSCPTLQTKILKSSRMSQYLAQKSVYLDESRDFESIHILRQPTCRPWFRLQSLV